jgi:hypothetical protein
MLSRLHQRKIYNIVEQNKKLVSKMKQLCHLEPFSGGGMLRATWVVASTIGFKKLIG